MLHYSLIPHHLIDSGSESDGEENENLSEEDKDPPKTVDFNEPQMTINELIHAKSFQTQNNSPIEALNCDLDFKSLKGNLSKN